MKNKLTAELTVCGFNAVLALAETHPNKIKRLFFNKDRAKAFGPTCKYLAENKKPYRLVEDEELFKLSKTEHHQGVVAIISMPELPELTHETMAQWAAEAKNILILEDIGNSHNLGAIARSAAFFGIKAIVLHDTGKASEITTSAYRVAEGGMEHVELFCTADLGSVVEGLPEAYRIIGADHRGRFTINEAGAMPTEGKGCAIVLGNEEDGISFRTRRLCSWMVRIPGAGALESLNVAQAAAIFMSRLPVTEKEKPE
jgi:TrmH RNA methyltransferase